MITKCSSREGQFEPFYLIQSSDEGKRYVVGLNDKLYVRVLLAGFINASRSVQLKIVDFDDSENPIDYSGVAKRKSLHKTLDEFEDVLFSNGFFDLMIRNPKSGDYIVYDEHGLIFIYSDKDYSSILKNTGAEFKPDQKLIYEFDHWHRKEANGSERFEEFIKSLKMTMD